MAYDISKKNNVSSGIMSFRDTKKIGMIPSLVFFFLIHIATDTCMNKHSLKNLQM